MYLLSSLSIYLSIDLLFHYPSIYLYISSCPKKTCIMIIILYHNFIISHTIRDFTQRTEICDPHFRCLSSEAEENSASKCSGTSARDLPADFVVLRRFGDQEITHTNIQNGWILPG